jgi:hypothetical protein
VLTYFGDDYCFTSLLFLFGLGVVLVLIGVIVWLQCLNVFLAGKGNTTAVSPLPSVEKAPAFVATHSPPLELAPPAPFVVTHESNKPLNKTVPVDFFL